MENLKTLEAFLEEHKHHLGCTLEEGETIRVAIDGIGEAFLLGQNGHAEEILCHSLGDPRMSVRFSAFCALLKAQKFGRKLQDKTQEALERLRKSDDCHNLMIVKAVGKKSKQEGWS